MSTQLTSTLSGLKRRLIALGLWAGLGWGLLIGSVVLLAAMWLDLVLEMPPYLRIGSGGLALAAAAGLLAAMLAVAWRATAPLSLARRIDQAGGTGGQVLSGVDLLLAKGERPSLTEGLAQLAIQRAAQVAAGVRPAAAAPAVAAAWPYLGLAAMCALAAIVTAAAPRLARTQWGRFLDPFGDHPPYSRLVIAVEPGDARVVYGGSLDIHATAQGGVAESMEVLLQNADGTAETLPMFPEAEGKWRATMASITSPVGYAVRAQGARSKRYTIEVITVPRIEGVRFRVTPPAYTHRPPYEGPLPQGGLAGLPGTKVEVTAKSNRPLSGGWMAFEARSGGGAPATAPATQPTPVAMMPAASASNEATGSFIIEKGGRLTLKVTDVQGQASTDTFASPVSLLADGRPFVRILEPKPQSMATPDVVLQVQVIAEDDYGISRLQVYRGLNDSRMREMRIPVPATAPTRLPAIMPLPLADYGVGPGDVVKLFARVEDNDPAGAKGSESPMTVIQIISQEEMQRMMVAQQGLETLLSKFEQANRRFEALREELQKLQEALGKLKEDEPLPESLKRELADLARTMETDAKELAKAAEEKLPFDTDKILNVELQKASGWMAEQAKAAKSLGQGTPTAGKVAKGIKEMADALGGEREDYGKKVTEPLDHLAKVFPLKEDEAEFVAIYQRQKDLAERLVALWGVNGDDDPTAKNRMRELEEEQRQIRDDLRGLLDKIDADAAQLPEDPRLDELKQTAKRFAQTARDSGAAGKMQTAESALAEFTGSPAQTAANEAAEALKKLLGQCKGMGEQAKQGLKFQPQLAQALGDTVDQLLEAQGLGAKSGDGDGGGYSMRRNTLRNVGLYGSRPLRSQESKAGGGRDMAVGGSSRHGVADRGGNDAGDTPGARSGGDADVPVPSQYKRRVGDYFQRVADEVEQ